jgi:hypothetical protein
MILRAALATRDEVRGVAIGWTSERCEKVNVMMESMRALIY